MKSATPLFEAALSVEARTQTAAASAGAQRRWLKLDNLVVLWFVGGPILGVVAIVLELLHRK